MVERKAVRRGGGMGEGADSHKERRAKEERGVRREAERVREGEVKERERDSERVGREREKEEERRRGEEEERQG